MLWVFPTESKRAPVRIICFILTTLNNENQLLKLIRFYKNGVLENSTDVPNLLVDKLKISMETTGVDVSWLNCNNERHNRSMHNMLTKGIIDSTQHTNKCCFASMDLL